MDIGDVGTNQRLLLLAKNECHLMMRYTLGISIALAIRSFDLRRSAEIGRITILLT